MTEKSGDRRYRPTCSQCDWSATAKRSESQAEHAAERHGEIRHDNKSAGKVEAV